MNYQRIHDLIIAKARSENRQKRKTDHPDFIYYEAHHIIPRCLGGQGTCAQWKTHPNIVLLTAKEHFVIHRLLHELHPNNKGLTMAFRYMCGRSVKGHLSDVKVTSNTYADIKQKFSQMVSQISKEMWKRPGYIDPVNSKGGHSEESKAKMSDIRSNAILVFDTKGNFVKEIKNSRILQSEGFTQTGVARCARNAENSNTYKGYIFIYKKLFTPELLKTRVKQNKLNNCRGRAKKIVILDKEGNVINTFNSKGMLQKHLGITRGMFYNILAEKIHLSNKRKIKYV